jgi:beta-glucanase (GH16 family)
MIIFSVLASILFACGYPLKPDNSNLDNEKFQEYLQLPDLINAGTDETTANESGWYETLIENFDGDSFDITKWTYSPQAYRTKTNSFVHPEYTSYWSGDMVSVKNGNLEITSEQKRNYTSSDGIYKNTSGRFTGGIETRLGIRNSDDVVVTQETYFKQAFGYYETRVRFPKEEGLWTSFWLQTDSQGQIGNDGEDGTEIDVYESCFIKNPSYMGHALTWDGYAGYSNGAGYKGNFESTISDFYNDFHTFALLWTPVCYVFFIDGNPTWVTDEGGVSKVEAYLRLTVEIDEGDTWGPHAQIIGPYRSKGSIFYVDYVKVYQNTGFIEHIKKASDFRI